MVFFYFKELRNQQLMNLILFKILKYLKALDLLTKANKTLKLCNNNIIITQLYKKIVASRNYTILYVFFLFGPITSGMGFYNLKIKAKKYPLKTFLMKTR